MLMTSGSGTDTFKADSVNQKPLSLCRMLYRSLFSERHSELLLEGYQHIPGVLRAPHVAGYLDPSSVHRTLSGPFASL